MAEKRGRTGEYAPFRQRIDIYCTVPPLDRAECEDYINTHMQYAGCTQNIFTDSAVDRIYQISNGVPRMVNRVCEKSLMYASQTQKRLVDDHMVSYVSEHEMLVVNE